MVRWQAIGPTSISLGWGILSHDDITVATYDSEQFAALLNENDLEYWSKVSLNFLRSGSWIKLDFEVNPGEDEYQKAVRRIMVLFQALGLYKTMPAVLTMGGLLVRRMEEGSGPKNHFGWETTIFNQPYYFLEKNEYRNFLDLLTDYNRFLLDNERATDTQFRRIQAARHFFTRSLLSRDLIDRHINLSIALESLYGEGQQELKYRFSNRAAVLLGDNVERRKEVYDKVGIAYDKRSDLLHGRLGWEITSTEVMDLQEIIRQSLLRCISLYTQGHRNIINDLDDCLHDPDKHQALLRDVKRLFANT